MKNEAHIPTLLGILILLIGMSATFFLVENGSKLLTQAKIEDKPQQVTVANITDTSFVVSWFTQNRTIGAVKYREKNLLGMYKLAFDTRDSNYQKTRRYTHYVNISSAKSNTNYEVIVISNNIDQPTNKLAINTGRNLPAPIETVDPAFGTLIDERNHPVSEALAFVSFEGSQLISTLVNSDGSWVLPLGEMRSDNGERYFVATKKDQERFFFITRDTQSTVLATIEHDSPLPPIRIGENYNFTKVQASRFLPIIAQENIGGTNTGTVSTSLKIELPLPKSNIPSGKPAFKGTGTPEKEVIVSISGPTILSEKVMSSPNGNWSWTPKNALLPGNYVATIASFNANNSPVSTSISFTVLKSGTSVLGDATPAASIEPTPSATPLQSPSPTASVTPVTGNWEPTVFILGIGIVLLIFGSLTFVKTNK